MSQIIQDIQSYLLAESKAIQNIPVNNDYEKVIELLHQKIHKEQGKLVTSGMGKAGQVAYWVATTYSSTGTPAVFLHPSDAQHGDLGLIQPNDVLLLITNSGKTREIIELIELTNRLHADIPKILITGNLEAPIRDSVDVILHTGNPKEICPLGMTPTVSHTVMTVIGDVLVASMIQKIGFTKEAYSKRHHGGYLGEKSRG